MSVDYQAAIMVGLRREDIKHEDLESLIDEEELEVCAPYYDGDGDDDAIVGLVFKRSGPYCPKELEWDQARIDKLRADFKLLTGQEAKVWISPRGH